MAEADYQRLAAACACGEPLKVFASSGRTSKRRRDDCKAVPAWKVERKCPACDAAFTPKKPDHFTCGPKCRQRLRLKPLLALLCKHCSAPFTQRRHDQFFCSKVCKVRRWVANNPDRYAELVARAAKQRKPTLCPYFAGICACGKSHGSRRRWERCPPCEREHQKRAISAANLLAALAMHRASAKVSQCAECGAQVCRLYGAKPGAAYLCSAECQSERLRKTRRVSKMKREAVERGVDAEAVDPLKVFERDGWKCRLCGIDTPKQLRGTYEHDAPELDHRMPVSRGGSHTYANTQCLCRSCNQFKSDRTMEEVEQALS